ncbi:MAG: sulfotransferase [Vicinamibacterales bacterium]
MNPILLDVAPVAAPTSPLTAGATVICTLGMHRSGTSLVSRILNLLGVDLGPRALVGTVADDNPRGYWEHPSIRDINDEILARFGGYWHDPPAFPAKWTQDPRLADVKTRAAQLVQRNFAGKPVWGWKDPRTCLTLPFWQEVLGPMRYVICVRNPCAVAESLVTRDGIRFADAERLWLTHTQAALAQTAGHSRLLLFYEDLFEDWRPQLRRLSAFVGDPQRAEDPKVDAALAAFLDRGLWHHRQTLDDVLRSEGVSTATRSLYGLLREHHAQAANLETLRTHREQLTTRIRTMRDEASTTQREHATTIAGLEQDRHALSGTIHAIHASTSWRLAAAARAALATLLPYGTRRRLWFERAIRSVARRVGRSQPAVAEPRPA